MTTVTFIPSLFTVTPIEPVCLLADDIQIPPEGAEGVGLPQRAGIARVSVRRIEYNYAATITTSDEPKPGRCDILVEVAWDGKLDA